MAIYNELTSIRTQIEQYEGQLESLRERAARSTIDVSLEPDAAAGPLQPVGWRPGETVRGSLRQVVRAFQGLADFAIWALIVLLPVGAVVGGGVWLVVACGGACRSRAGSDARHPSSLRDRFSRRGAACIACRRRGCCITPTPSRRSHHDDHTDRRAPHRGRPRD